MLPLQSVVCTGFSVSYIPCHIVYILPVTNWQYVYNLLVMTMLRERLDLETHIIILFYIQFSLPNKIRKICLTKKQLKMFHNHYHFLHHILGKWPGLTCLNFCSWDGILSIIIRTMAGRYQIKILAGWKLFCLPKHLEFFPWGKQPRHEDDHSITYRPETKNVLRSTSIPMSSWHRENYIFVHFQHLKSSI